MNTFLKVIAVLLVAYSLLAGLLIPLNSGILAVTPRVVKGGETVKLRLQGYNARFKQDQGNYEARLRLNPKQAICANAITVENGEYLTMQFDLPMGELPVQDVMDDGKKSPFPLLELYGPNNGYSSLESAVYLRDSIVDSITVVPTGFCEAAPYPTDERDSVTFPFLNILEETIRNLYYHVPMWFAMMFLMLLSVIFSILYLMNPQSERYDIMASSLAAIGTLFGFIGLTTGMMWAKHTWGAYWSFDVKQNTSAVAFLIYMAYFVLRTSFDDMDKRARIAAIYNIFAFATLIPLLYIVPRMVDSLHPGMGGNPAFSKLDLDNTMRMVFYPAIIGWILMGYWMATIAARIETLLRKKQEWDA